MAVPTKDEVPLEYSLYHYYLWKERQTMIKEESNRRYNLNNKFPINANATNTTRTPLSTNDNNRVVNIDDYDNIDETIDYLNNASPYEESCKYRLIWNYVARLFPEIAEHFSVDEAAKTLPEVYRRYTEYPYLKKELQDIKRFGYKRSSDDDINYGSPSKRARVEAYLPWRGTKSMEVLRKPAATLTKSGKVSKTPKVPVPTDVDMISDNNDDEDKESRKMAFENYINSYKTGKLQGFSEAKIFSEACKHFKAFKRKDGKFYVSKKTHFLVFHWAKQVISLLKKNELTRRRIDQLLYVGFLRRKDALLDDSDDNNNDDNSDASESDHGTHPDSKRKNKGTNSERVSLRETKWNAHFEELKKFHKIHGHFSMPRANLRMKNWVQFQIISRRENKLSMDKIKKLESIGFAWEAAKSRTSAAERQPMEFVINFVPLDENYQEPVRPVVRETKVPYDLSPYDVVWNQHFKDLVEFKRLFNHTIVPKSEMSGYQPLYVWLRNQRISYQKGRMPPHRRDCLLDLGVELGQLKQKKQQ